MNREQVEARLCELPRAQYAWVQIEDIPYSDRIRYVCETECPMYGKSWACPPAVGPVRECQERCKSYSGALVSTTVSEVQDISDLKETLATRAPHEGIKHAFICFAKVDFPEPLCPRTQIN